VDGASIPFYVILIDRNDKVNSLHFDGKTNRFTLLILK